MCPVLRCALAPRTLHAPQWLLEEGRQAEVWREGAGVDDRQGHAAAVGLRRGRGQGRDARVGCCAVVTQVGTRGGFALPHFKFESSNSPPGPLTEWGGRIAGGGTSRSGTPAAVRSEVCITRRVMHGRATPTVQRKACGLLLLAGHSVEHKARQRLEHARPGAHLQPILPHRHLDVQLAQRTARVRAVLNLQGKQQAGQQAT